MWSAEPRRVRPSPWPAGGGGVGEDVAAGAVVGVAAAAGLVWATGELAARLAGGVGSAVGPAELVGVLGRLPGSVTDPGGAWPAGSPAAPLGPVLWWTCFVVLVVPPLGAAAVGWRLTKGRRAASPARWARRWELCRLRVRRPGAGRLVLGRAGRGLVATGVAPL